MGSFQITTTNGVAKAQPHYSTGPVAVSRARQANSDVGRPDHNVSVGPQRLHKIMKFRNRNLRAIAEMVIGDAPYFPYRSSSFITQFFEECDLDFVHDGSTRWSWTVDRLTELLEEPQPRANALPERFVHVLRVLMQKSDAENNDPQRVLAMESLNKPLEREGFEAFYGEDNQLYIRHVGSNTLSIAPNPHRPFTPNEVKRREQLTAYLDKCSEDDLIEIVLLPLFRQLGFHRITAAGHKDKALEYGKGRLDALRSSDTACSLLRHPSQDR